MIKRALYKLAALRLAINYVLRSRYQDSMEKQAFGGRFAAIRAQNAYARGDTARGNQLMNLARSRGYNAPQPTNTVGTKPNPVTSVKTPAIPTPPVNPVKPTPSGNTTTSALKVPATKPNYVRLNMNFRDGKYYGKGDISTWGDQIAELRNRLKHNWEQVPDKDRDKWRPALAERTKALDELEANWKEYNSLDKNNVLPYENGRYVGSGSPDTWEAKMDNTRRILELTHDMTSPTKMTPQLKEDFNKKFTAVNNFYKDYTPITKVEPGYTKPWARDIWSYNPEKTQVPITSNSTIYSSGAPRDDVQRLKNLAMDRSRMAPQAKPSNIVMTDYEQSYNSRYSNGDSYTVLGGYNIPNPNYEVAKRNARFYPSTSDKKITSYHWHSPATYWHETGHEDYKSLFPGTKKQDSLYEQGKDYYDKLKSKKLTFDKIPEKDRAAFEAGQKQIAETEYPAELQRLGYTAQSPENFLELYRNLQGPYGKKNIFYVYPQLSWFANLGYVDPALNGAADPDYNVSLQPLINEATVNEMKEKVDNIVNDPALDEDTKRLKYQMLLKEYLPANLYNMAIKGVSMPITRTASEVNDPRYQEARRWITEKLKQEMANEEALPWNTRRYLMDNDIDTSLDFSNPGNVLTFDQLRRLYKRLHRDRKVEELEQTYGPNWTYGV